MIEWFYGRPFQKTTRCQCPTQDLEPSKRRKTIWDKRLVSRATLHIGQVLMQKLMNKYKNTITRPPTSSHYKGRLKWLRGFFWHKKGLSSICIVFMKWKFIAKKKTNVNVCHDWDKCYVIHVKWLSLDSPTTRDFHLEFHVKNQEVVFCYLIIASLERDCSKMVQNNPIIEKCFAKDVKKLCKLKDEYALNIFRHKS